MKTNNDTKITSYDWIVSEKTITTKGGVYVGTAKTIECAKVMAASTRLLKLIQEEAKKNPRIEKQIDAIFRDL